jgi:hypothetical protein
MNKCLRKEINHIHNFISRSGSETVFNYGSRSGSEFLTSYGSGSTSQKVTVLVPQHCLFYVTGTAYYSMKADFNTS